MRFGWDHDPGCLQVFQRSREAENRYIVDGG